MKNLSLIGVFFLVLIGCENANEYPRGSGHFPLNEVFYLKYQWCLSDDDNAITVCLDFILTDSRCPFWRLSAFGQGRPLPGSGSLPYKTGQFFST